MSDDLTKKGPRDSSRINLHEPWEVTQWTKTLHVSEARLRQAVAAVGVMAKDVREWLKKN